MATGIGGSIGQLLNGKEPVNAKNVSLTKNPKSPVNSKTNKTTSDKNIFGESAKVELSPGVEMYGKVVDLLQKKYENADVFVAGPEDDLSQIGGDLEYSIILSEDEVRLLASEDPADKKEKDKLLGKIDEAMKTISDMNGKITENTDESDEISNFGIQMDKDGNLKFFADINGNSFKADDMDSLISDLLASKKA